MPRSRMIGYGLLLVTAGVFIGFVCFRWIVRGTLSDNVAPPANELQGDSPSLAQKSNAIKPGLPPAAVHPSGAQGPGTTSSAHDVHNMQWGHLRGRFVFVGKAPERKRIVAAKGTPTCDTPLYDESLTIGQDGGLANVFVWLVTDDLIHELPVHPSYAKDAKEKVLFKFKQCQFEPRAGLLRTSQTLVEDNQDKITHDPKLGLWSNAPS